VRPVRIRAHAVSLWLLWLLSRSVVVIPPRDSHGALRPGPTGQEGVDVKEHGGSQKGPIRRAQPQPMTIDASALNAFDARLIHRMTEPGMTRPPWGGTSRHRPFRKILGKPRGTAIAGT
jgi:hypothetical protein